MNTLELMQSLQNDSNATDVLCTILQQLIREDSDLRSALVAVILEDVSFGINCSDSYDYYSHSYRVSLSLNGSEVASDYFSFRSN